MGTAQLGTLLRHIHKLAGGDRIRQRTDRELLDDFVSRRDEAAFAALIGRHGPMVLRVCRRVLRHEQDAEDAFQASFLVLARNAGSIRKREAIASWLHGVAYRIAMNARRSAARRRAHEARLSVRPPSTSPSWDDVQSVLDEEIQHLPQRFREAFVQRVLESRSGPEAAAALGWKEGTVKSRLSRARRLLQGRLERRGIQLTALLAALSVAERGGRAALPVLLARTAVRGGLSAAARGLPGAIPAHVAALAAGVTRAMFLTRAKMVVLVLLATGLIATGGSMLCHHAALDTSGGVEHASPPLRPSDISAKAASVEVAAGRQKTDAVKVGGRVLDPDGRPVPGAKLFILYGWARKLPARVCGTSGADGRFKLTVARQQDYDQELESSWQDVYLLAAAQGYGCAVARLGQPESTADLILNLTKDVPIRGRVLDLQGRPVPGIRVSITNFNSLNTPHLHVPKKDDLTAWLTALKANRKDPWDIERTYLAGLYYPAWELLIPPVSTGADGRFELRGIGRERLVHLRLEGPSIATEIVNVMTRPSEKIRLPLSVLHPKGEPITYYGAAFEMVAAPTRPVTGIVRDKVTGEPLPGTTIWPNKVTNPFGISNYNAGLVRTVTDKQGRYRLLGLPIGDDNQLMARTGELPYLPVSQKVPNVPGREPVTLDFALKRGVWVKGRVLEKFTGKPLRGGVNYHCFSTNPHKEEIPLVFGGGLDGAAHEDGSFQIVVPPGRGVIAVQVEHNYRYVRGAGAEKVTGPRHRQGGNECLDTYPFLCHPSTYNALVEIAPRQSEAAITRDLIVVPIDGRQVKGSVLGPDGKPLAGATWGWGGDRLRGSDFTIKNVEPNEKRVLHFVHEGKKAAGCLTLQGDEKGPVQVRLQPWGSVIGRVLTQQGDPLTGVAVEVLPASRSGADSPGDVVPDKNGRFRIDGLTPRLKYAGLSVAKDGLGLEIVAGNPQSFTLRPGETKYVGDLKVRLSR
jgi:RNA polymerase sigma factor (sigma-70 family)